jgi:ATP-binding protein involved in chromosome partitioning
MTELTQTDIEKTLSKVMHPEINYSLVDLGMIEEVVYKQKHVSLALNLPSLQVPVKGILVESIKKVLADLDSSIEVEINIEQLNEQQREKFMKMAKEGWKF